MSLPIATISSPIRAGATRRSLPPGCPYTAASWCTCPLASVSGGASRVGTRSTAMSRFGSNATTTASCCRCCESSTVVPDSPATTCAFVTTKCRRATHPLPSWYWLQALPATFTTDCLTLRSTSGGTASFGGRPGLGGSSSGPSAVGYGAWEIRSPHAAKRGGCCGPTSSIQPTTAEPRATRAGHPSAVASDGIVIHRSISTPKTPTAAPAARSHTGSPRTSGRSRCSNAPTASPTPCPSVATRTRNSNATVTRSSAAVPPNAVTTPGTKWIPISNPSATPAHARRRATKPNRQPPIPAAITATMMMASSAFTARRSRLGDEQARVGEETGVRDHPVVGPDRLPLDVPAAIEHFERLDHPPRTVGELLAQPADLQDRRQVRDQHAARLQRGHHVLHRPPRFGQVEHDAVDVGLVDP